MVKLLAQLEHTIGDKVFTLICDHDSPLEQVYNGICGILGQVVQLQVEAAKKQQEATPPPAGHPSYGDENSSNIPGV